MWSVRLRPDDAYRYAFGEAVMLPPNDASDERGTREARIDRPLDFAAVTDHAEFLGESALCIDANSPVHDSDFCQEYRQSTGRSIRLGMRIFSPLPWRDEAICGEDGSRCAEASREAWQEIIRAAESWNDDSERCERTAFIAYEYSSHRMGSNLHRNVIFRNHIVPPNPVSYVEASREWLLWARLRDDCIASGTGCDALAIPHNSNISNGRMFAIDYPGVSGEDAQAARAALRIAVEPIVEINQHKGDSECHNGVSGVLTDTDELCEFEKFENLTLYEDGDPGACYEGPLTDYIFRLGPSCLSPQSYVRYALTLGLGEEARIGINPFKFGITASTDTHNALAGGVAEKTFAGHIGIGDDTVAKRTSPSREVPGNTFNSPGGLTGVWAEENSRDALFEAMQRKEVFGTSGPRIKPRFFGGFGYAPSLCGDPSMLEKAYADGVAMGGELRESGAGAPSFIAAAQFDPGTSELPGTPLQRLQIVKGWIDGDGIPNQKVYEVAGDAENGASVDLDSCERQGAGSEQLCTVWTDPDFDRTRRAVYYLRAVENPSCRYSAWQCVALTGAKRPETCDDPMARRHIQERAWSSPIWYTPQAG